MTTLNDTANGRLKEDENYRLYYGERTPVEMLQIQLDQLLFDFRVSIRTTRRAMKEKLSVKTDFSEGIQVGVLIENRSYRGELKPRIRTLRRYLAELEGGAA